MQPTTASGKITKMDKAKPNRSTTKKPLSTEHHRLLRAFLSRGGGAKSGMHQEHWISPVNAFFLSGIKAGDKGNNRVDRHGIVVADIDRRVLPQIIGFGNNMWNDMFYCVPRRNAAKRQVHCSRMGTADHICTAALVTFCTRFATIESHLSGTLTLPPPTRGQALSQRERRKRI